MKRVAIYARVSIDDRDEGGESVKTQIRVCKEYALKQGWQVVATFEDNGVSGTVTPDQRPGGARLYAARNAGEFDILLVTEPTRLYRSGDLTNELKRWKYRQVRVVFLSGGIDTDQKHYKAMAGMHGIMGEQYVDMISEKVHQALGSRALARRWTGGRIYGYALQPITDATRRDQYGAPLRIGSTLVVDSTQAGIVRQIFTRFTEGASCLTIAKELNAADVPSPGSAWKRTGLKRLSGWMASGVRVMLKNPTYRGEVRWNLSQWVKDPDNTSVKKRLERPKEDWDRFTYQDENLRIVTDELWHGAQARTKSQSNPAESLKHGGKSKYLLSGLLRCGLCGRSYTTWGVGHYACGSYQGGGACENGIRVKRKVVEDVILSPILNELLEPKRVERMVKEMQKEAQAQLDSLTTKAAAAPKELRDLDERIARLRKRLTAGDPDMTSDEIQAALDKATAKRQGLLTSHPGARATAKLLRVLPQAAKLYCEQIRAGLDGDRVAAAKARTFLQNKLLLGGEIRLVPEGRSLFAEYAFQRIDLLGATTGSKLSLINQGDSTSGSGGRI